MKSTNKRANDMVELLFISYRMGGVNQARRALKQLKKQNYNQHIARNFKWLSETKTDEEFQTRIEKTIEVWNDPKNN